MIDDDRPHAFCAGLLSPRVYVTSGALAILDESALEAVLAHERHHARRRDPLRLATSRVLTRAMFFLPALGELDRGQQALAEMSADESAIEAAPGNRSALARAMLTFSDASEADDSVGIDPARVDYLLGEPPRWRFPAMLCLVAIGLLALVVTTAVLVAAERQRARRRSRRHSSRHSRAWSCSPPFRPRLGSWPCSWCAEPGPRAEPPVSRNGDLCVTTGDSSSREVDLRASAQTPEPARATMARAGIGAGAGWGDPSGKASHRPAGDRAPGSGRPPYLLHSVVAVANAVKCIDVDL